MIKREDDYDKKDKWNKKPVIGNSIDRIKNSVVSRTTRGVIKAGKAIAGFFGFLLNTLVALCTPVGLVLILLLLIVWASVSGSLVYGPIEFSNVCNDNGTPKVQNLEGEEREGAIYSYFIDRVGVSKEAAAYIAELENKNNYDKVIGANSQDCDIDCLIALSIDPNYKDKLSLGAFSLRGDDAYNLLMKSKESGVDWKDPSLQLDVVAEKVSSIMPDKGVILKDPMQSEKAIKEIAALFGRELSNKDLNKAKDKVKKKSETVEEGKVQCVTMGSGQGRSRITGGSATDTSGTNFTNFDGLDFDDIVSFMNSFVEDHVVHPPIIGYTKDGAPIYDTGIGKANQNYIKAKRKAEQLGGKDSDKYWASCDRFVATVIKAMEIDVKFPWGGAANQMHYMESSKCWGQVNLNDISSGDVVTWTPVANIYDGHGHIGIYADEHFYEASYGYKYPHKWAANKATIIKEIQKDPRPAKVFRYNDSIPGCEIKRTEKSNKEKVIEALEGEIEDEKEP